MTHMQVGRVLIGVVEADPDCSHPIPASGKEVFRLAGAPKAADANPGYLIQDSGDPCDRNRLSSGSPGTALSGQVKEEYL